MKPVLNLRWLWIWVIGLCVNLEILPAQSLAQRKFFQPDSTFSARRFWGVQGTIVTAYSVALIGLNEVWYKQYPRGSFRFFNDGKEWLQMDKGGHIYSTYFQTVWIHEMYRWSGVRANHSPWMAAGMAITLQSTIEILDGFSSQWGFSWPDIAANASGALWAAGQYSLWKEQRIRIKGSAWPVTYSPQLRDRVQSLYGTSLPERLIKDYNAMTFWLSGNIHAFLSTEKQTRFPSWLNIAVGYGASGMLGGFQNSWCIEKGDPPCLPEDMIHRFDIPRRRAYYLSLDADLSRIPVKRAWAKSLLGVLNIIKIPAPALMIRDDGRLRFYPIYF